MGGLKLGGGGGGGDNRNALLQSIQMGAKLKKVQTVDKSGPLIAGKVSGAGSGGSAATSSSVSTGGVRRPTAAVANGAGVGSVGAGAPKLGGIFEGLSSMPKLKPVGSRGM